VVATWSLLVGTDGVEKMSKSLGNYVGITDEPADMFGTLMSIPDDVLPHYFALLTDRGFDGAEELDADIQSGEVHPMDAKKELAGIIVERYHDADAAVAARAEFESVFSRGNLPSDMPECEVAAADLDDGAIWIVGLVVAAGFAASNGEARRLVRGGGVKLGDEKVADENAQVAVADGDILQVGKRRFARLKIV
jgi:tyrosyl-tRNA synthetase